MFLYFINNKKYIFLNNYKKKIIKNNIKNKKFYYSKIKNFYKLIKNI
ncbi:hypothetical protein [Candidatus Carsonella ruddii]